MASAFGVRKPPIITMQLSRSPMRRALSTARDGSPWSS
jgi:hypothetical protein